MVLAALSAWTIPARAQEPASRQKSIEEAEAEKAQKLTPQTPSKAELVTARITHSLEADALKLHPFFNNAYAGGGFTLGAGYTHHVSPFRRRTPS